MFASVSVFRGTLKAKANGRETVLKDISKYKYHAGKDYSCARLKLKAIDGKALLKNIFKVHDNGKDYSCLFNFFFRPSIMIPSVFPRLFEQSFGVLWVAKGKGNGLEILFLWEAET